MGIYDLKSERSYELFFKKNHKLTPQLIKFYIPNID